MKSPNYTKAGSATLRVADGKTLLTAHAICSQRRTSSLHIPLLFKKINQVKMAVSLGVFPSTLVREMVSFASLKSPSSSLRLVLPLSVNSNMHGLRTVTTAAASKPAAESTTVKREPRGITKPRRVSPQMQELLGVSEISRTQALKEIWAYIKQNNLQVSIT